jgi:cell division protein FtsL
MDKTATKRAKYVPVESHKHISPSGGQAQKPVGAEYDKRNLGERAKELIAKQLGKLGKDTKIFVMGYTVAVLIAAGACTYNIISNSAVNKLNNDLGINITNSSNIQMDYDINRDTKKLEVRTYAIPQNISPKDINDRAFYLLNGRTDATEWYQGGIAYVGGKFYLTYETMKGENYEFDSSPQFINFSKKVNSNDEIQIKLEIGDDKKVRLSAIDLNNGATAAKEFPTKGTVFKGGLDERTGYQTGVFTEIWINNKENFSNSEINKQRYKIIYPPNLKNTSMGFGRLWFPKGSNTSTQDVVSIAITGNSGPAYLELSKQSTHRVLIGLKEGITNPNEFYTEGVR